MSDVPIQIVAAAFNSPDGAANVMKELKQARNAGLVGIQNAAILTKDASGKLEIDEPTDWGGGKGAVVGGVTGAAIGLLAGPVGWAVGLGALVGGLAAKLRDSGFSDERLRKLGESLKPNTSAVVVVIEHRWVREVERQLAEAGANTLTEEIGADIATQLEAGRDVAYSALSAAGVMSVERTSVGEKDANLSSITVTPDEVTVIAAEVTVEEGDGAKAVTDAPATAEAGAGDGPAAPEASADKGTTPTATPA